MLQGNWQALHHRFQDAIRHELEHLEETKTFKKETLIESEQGAVVRVGGRDVIMLASNNYLGLASHPRIREAAMNGLREFGHGVASVRFLCGTQTIHRQLEEKIAEFLGTYHLTASGHPTWHAFASRARVLGLSPG